MAKTVKDRNSPWSRYFSVWPPEVKVMPGLQLVASRTVETADLTQQIPLLHPSANTELLGVKWPPCARSGGRCRPFCTLFLILGFPAGAAWPLSHT